MQKLNKEKETLSQKLLKINQYRSELKSDQNKPVSSYRKSTQNDYSTGSIHFNQSNSILNKTNANPISSIKEYSSSIKRRNEGIGETKSYQVTNNYKVVDKDEKKATGSKDIDHKKWGIRPRRGEATPLIPLNNIEDRINIKRETNVFSTDKIIPKYNSNISSKYNSNSNTHNNIYISGSSQSNYITIDQNSYKRNFGNDNKSNDKLSITSNTSSLLNNNLLKSPTPLLRQNYSSQKSSSSLSSYTSNALKNNNNAITIHSTVETKKYQINHLLYMKEKMKLLNLNREVKEQN